MNRVNMSAGFLDDEDDDWLIPKKEGEESFDFNAFCKVPLSAGASSLSNRIARHAQKRATRASSLRAVREESPLPAKKDETRAKTVEVVAPPTFSESLLNETWGSARRIASEVAAKRRDAPNPDSYSDSFNNYDSLDRMSRSLDQFPMQDSPVPAYHHRLTGSPLLSSTPRGSPAGLAGGSAATSSYLSPTSDAAASRPPSGADLLISPIYTSPVLALETPAEEVYQSASDEDEFHDAEADFSEEAWRQISMTASFGALEELLSDNLQDVHLDGQSCVRASMTQSLVKVEEEEPTSQNNGTNNTRTAPRHARSSSVSPRPQDSIFSTNNHNSPNARTVAPNSSPNGAQKQQQHLSPFGSTALRRSLGAQPMSQLAQTQTRGPLQSAAYSTPTHRPSRSPRNGVNGTLNPLHRPTAQQLLASTATPPSHQNNTPASSTPRLSMAPRPSPSPLANVECNPELMSLQERARQQEEALLQGLQQTQRKHSWQGDRGQSTPPSAHSSAGSLASSKSVDIAALNKIGQTPQRTSRLPQPRRTGIPMPSRVSGHARGSGALVGKSRPSSEDECF